MFRCAALSLFVASTCVSLSGTPAKAQYYGPENRRAWQPSDDLVDMAPYGADALRDENFDDNENPRKRRQARRPAGHAARTAEIPRDADPAWSSPTNDDANVDPSVATARRVPDPTSAAPGDITIDTHSRKLYLSLENGDAIQYGVGVGRRGFAWKGEAHIGRKAFWPGWTPPREMLLRRPELPEHMEGGLDNPLGARALYLFDGNRDTMFRIHGTNEPDSIGKAVSSGCIRMLNADVIDLYGRVGKGTRVVVR